MSALPRNYTIMLVANIAKQCFKLFKILLLSLCFWEFQVRFKMFRMFFSFFRFRESNLNSGTELNINCQAKTWGGSKVTLKAVSHDFTYQECLYTSASESPEGKIRMSTPLAMPILKITLTETFAALFPMMKTSDHFYTLFITIISS